MNSCITSGMSLFTIKVFTSQLNNYLVISGNHLRISKVLWKQHAQTEGIQTVVVLANYVLASLRGWTELLKSSETLF